MHTLDCLCSNFARNALFVQKMDSLNARGRHLYNAQKIIEKFGLSEKLLELTRGAGPRPNCLAILS